MLRKKLVALLVAAVMIIPTMTAFGANPIAAPSVEPLTQLRIEYQTKLLVLTLGDRATFTTDSWNAFTAAMSEAKAMMANVAGTTDDAALAMVATLDPLPVKIVNGNPPAAWGEVAGIGPRTNFSGTYAINVGTPVPMYLNPTSVNGATAVNWYYCDMNTILSGANNYDMIERIRNLAVKDIVAVSDYGSALPCNNTSAAYTYSPDANQGGKIKIFWAQFVDSSNNVVATSNAVAVVVLPPPPNNQVPYTIDGLTQLLQEYGYGNKYWTYDLGVYKWTKPEVVDADPISAIHQLPCGCLCETNPLQYGAYMYDCVVCGKGCAIVDEAENGLYPQDYPDATWKSFTKVLSEAALVINQDCNYNTYLGFYGADPSLNGVTCSRDPFLEVFSIDKDGNVVPNTTNNWKLYDLTGAPVGIDNTIMPLIKPVPGGIFKVDGFDCPVNIVTDCNKEHYYLDLQPVTGSQIKAAIDKVYAARAALNDNIRRDPKLNNSINMLIDSISKNYKASDYASWSWDALQTAITNAKVVASSSYAKISELAIAYSYVCNALNKLVVR